ncbi:DUF4258 domain-containing protein [Flavobacterium oreochromis]|uniref:DUF4258 domain-containing protein n=1 Tax=Flavobacterium oreochromis TaxID=2906078 RepID=A0ABW8P6B3_9FLAO|nr:DUF4258 domain-containing protein [Flavobacterium oreochromis]OWP76592.1 hypothetical protein BWG23_07455 [Flavobacterium oreochromis]POR21201.1 hypothetical protein BWK58_12750 [Flavobacterium columnare]
MSTFTYRLAYYLFGVLGGSIVLFFVLNQKKTSCSYFPNDRVLNNLRSKPFHYSKEASKILNENWIDTTDIKNTLTYGDVDFDRSNIRTKSGGKRYIIEGFTTHKQAIELEIENFEDKAILKNIIKTK